MEMGTLVIFAAILLMARILGIDFGTKRIGFAVTDPLKIIVSPLTTIDASDAITFLDTYLKEEEVELIVCGDPGPENKEVRKALAKFVKNLKAHFARIPIVFQDEHFSSRRASTVILKSGLGQKGRRDKSLVDKVSAVLILQDYLGHLNDIQAI